MKAFVSLAVVLTALGGYALVAQGQQADTPGRGGAFAVRRAEHVLKITDAQREQIKTILQTEKPKLLEMRTQAEAERTEMDAGQGFDEAHARAVAEKYAQANSDMLVERARVRAELLAVLTTEQKAKLQAVRARLGSMLDSRLAVLGDAL